ncbi:hypothetical protein QBC46DRAFT_2889 [Diplogelasinospora grovesii]|uniref:Uncharacterized protein n=1 Tax=Diplogelasinospora grovesii TaxID=303347 RepID=A0AAN6NLH9_9PEZI|nr:hypothetical protein QBC46DRAFT_2889 [Diplogelasinospora grovesii]
MQARQGKARQHSISYVLQGSERDIHGCVCMLVAAAFFPFYAALHFSHGPGYQPWPSRSVLVLVQVGSLFSGIHNSSTGRTSRYNQSYQNYLHKNEVVHTLPCTNNAKWEHLSGNVCTSKATNTVPFERGTRGSLSLYRLDLVWVTRVCIVSIGLFCLAGH